MNVEPNLNRLCIAFSACRAVGFEHGLLSAVQARFTRFSVKLLRVGGANVRNIVRVAC